ncbi:hypothetical protein BVZ50_01075B, partial [Haemophilus influenzae]
SD